MIFRGLIFRMDVINQMNSSDICKHVLLAAISNLLVIAFVFLTHYNMGLVCMDIAPFYPEWKDHSAHPLHSCDI